MNKFARMEDAIAAVRSSYTDEIGGEHPTRTRYATCEVFQVGECHWWVTGHSWIQSWTLPIVENWRGMGLWLIHVYQDGEFWRIKRWDAFYNRNLSRYDCPIGFLDGIDVNREWREKVKERAGINK